MNGGTLTPGCVKKERERQRQREIERLSEKYFFIFDDDTPNISKSSNIKLV